MTAEVFELEMQLAGPLREVQNEFIGLGEEAGYVSSSIDTRANRVIVYWHGATVAEHPGISARAKERGIAVEIVRANFSTHDLVTAMQGLLAHIQDLEVGFIEYNRDGSGLTLHFRDATITENAKASLANAVAQAAGAGTIPDSPFYSSPGSPEITISDDPMNPVAG